MSNPITPEILRQAKRLGFSDIQLAATLGTTAARVRALRREWGIEPVFKTVDTCAAEFEAFTPYYYSTCETENESRPSDRKKVIILGGGPNRIGQGIEFDYCCVHGVFAVKEEGREAIMVNCNPETVSTDYDIADKLYFEPLTFEDVMRIVELEQPEGVIVSFGGQTPLKLAKDLAASGVPILGTPYEGIDLAEDRERFSALLTELGIRYPAAGNARTADEAARIAGGIGYPVLLRPSYVLGGRGMQIVYSEKTLRDFVGQALEISGEHPVLIDKFLEDAMEFDVDAVCDGTEVMIGGVLQHVEEAGIHSGDSTCVMPPTLQKESLIEELKETTRRLALALGTVGLINVQYALQNDIIYVLEANPRASRTVPFISKATGVPLAKIATKVMLGRTLRELGVSEPRISGYVAVKKAVFPFIKLVGSRQFLGPEMKSTGEVMGIADTYGEAMAKSQLGSGAKLPTAGTVFLSVSQRDKRQKTLGMAQSLIDAGFTIIATRGTSTYLYENGVETRSVLKVSEGRPDIVDEIKNGHVQLIINTPAGEVSRDDETPIGIEALAHNIPYITNISAGIALLEGIKQAQHDSGGVRSIQEYVGGRKETV
ncbi:MAG: carbamoyl-phosphate synthase large subunit [Ignavibacteria bacterium]|nr:carbamoyl-phosphate synthase large subunit [Ignavibacteria bacterium]